VSRAMDCCFSWQFYACQDRLLLQTVVKLLEMSFDKYHIIKSCNLQMWLVQIEGEGLVSHD